MTLHLIVKFEFDTYFAVEATFTCFSVVTLHFKTRRGIAETFFLNIRLGSKYNSEKKKLLRF